MDNPLRSLQAPHEPITTPWGQGGPEVVQGFGAYEAEYACIRKGAAFMDTPQRAAVELRGSERVDFLQRFVTNDVASLAPGGACRAFLLDRSGRIAADLVVLSLEQRTLLITAAADAAALRETLEGYVFTEDVTVDDLSGRAWIIAVHGPTAADLLASMGTAGLDALAPMHAGEAEVAGTPSVVYRSDETGSPGLHLVVPHDGAAGVYGRLLDRAADDGWEHEDPQTAGRARTRPIGWLAFNTARIEAGSPIYHVDFGPDSLPHETSLLDQAVCFTKGCYLGQEVVARMQSLGHPRRVLRGLRMPDDRLPVAGEPLFEPRADGSAGSAVGAVTSSAVSPMLGGVAVALAMVKWASHADGCELLAPAEDALVRGVVQGLRFI